MLRTILRVLLLGICVAALVAAFHEFGIWNQIVYWFNACVRWFRNLFSSF